MAHDFSTHNIAFRTPWISIYEKDTWYALASPSGKHGGATLVLDSLRRVLLVEIYRHPIDQTVLEIPRGAADPDDENSIATGLREAQEEAGIDLSGARVIDLGILHPDDGILAYENRLCAALLPTAFGEIAPDMTEVCGYSILPFAELRHQALTGKINEAHTIAAVFRLDAILRGEITP